MSIHTWGPGGFTAKIGDGDDRLTDALGADPLDVYLHRVWPIYQEWQGKRLRATRDTIAIRASNANTRLFMERISGAL